MLCNSDEIQQVNVAVQESEDQANITAKKVEPTVRQGWKEMEELVIKWMKKFDEEFGGNKWKVSSLPEHVIKLEDGIVPVYMPFIKYTGKEREFLIRTVKDWYERGIIRKSKSDWGMQLLVVNKPDPDGIGVKMRCVGNFIPLNRGTIPCSYPLPVINDIIRTANGKYKTKVDVDGGYLRVPLSEESKPLTAFVVEPIEGIGGHFEFNVMPVGLKNASKTFQKGIDELLQEGESIKGHVADAFQDDSLVWSSKKKQHLKDVDNLLERMFAVGLIPKWGKCKFGMKELVFCGKLLKEDCVAIDPTKIQALEDMKEPESFKELETFLGFTGYHMEFIPYFAEIVQPLRELLKQRKSGVKFEFQEVHKISFKRIIDAIKNATENHLPGEGVYHIFVDASKPVLAAHCIREHKGNKYMMGYVSRSLTKTELSYDTPKKEMMAIWFGCKSFEYLVTDRECILWTDHKSLSEMHLKNPMGIWARWLAKVHFKFTRN
jgi:hypothetical protein